MKIVAEERDTKRLEEFNKDLEAGLDPFSFAPKEGKKFWIECTVEDRVLADAFVATVVALGFMGSGNPNEKVAGVKFNQVIYDLSSFGKNEILDRLQDFINKERSN